MSKILSLLLVTFIILSLLLFAFWGEQGILKDPEFQENNTIKQIVKNAEGGVNNFKEGTEIAIDIERRLPKKQ